MDYNKIAIKTCVFFIGLLFLFAIGCSNEQKINTGNTYYVEIVNGADSLKQQLLAEIIGKTSYYKNNKLQIISLNYVTEDYPDMHYFKSAQELTPPIKKGVKKIRIEFAGNMTNDSTLYSIQKFTYNDDQWKKVSDLGFIKAYNRNIRVEKTAIFEPNDLAKEIIPIIVSTTY